MNRSLIIAISVIISLYMILNAVDIKAGGPEEKVQIITQEQAAELAAKLANEKYQTTFGISPFKPESYQATLVGTRWHWGKINAAISVNGCSAKVEFNKDGSEPDVKVAFHTDENFPVIIVPEEIQEIVPKMPER